MKLIQQDILALKEGIIFHQVNCYGHMGGGIAAALAKKYPGLEKAYRQYIKDIGKHSILGNVFVYRPDQTRPLWIVNIFGQSTVSNHERLTSYDATVIAFETYQDFINEESFKFNSELVELPTYFPFKMGCGIGGGSWPIYSAIIERYFPNAIICQHNA